MPASASARAAGVQPILQDLRRDEALKAKAWEQRQQARRASSNIKQRPQFNTRSVSKSMVLASSSGPELLRVEKSLGEVLDKLDAQSQMIKTSEKERLSTSTELAAMRVRPRACVYLPRR